VPKFGEAVTEHHRVARTGLGHVHPDAIGIDELMSELCHDRSPRLGWVAAASFGFIVMRAACVAGIGVRRRTAPKSSRRRAVWLNLTILRNRQYVQDSQPDALADGGRS